MNIYFVAGTLHREVNSKERIDAGLPSQIESVLVSGVWSADDESHAEQSFEAACHENYPGFTPHEIQTHCLDVEWVREACPEFFGIRSQIVGLDGKPL